MTCISIAEADKIVDNADPSFAIFPIFFEVVSAFIRLPPVLSNQGFTVAMSASPSAAHLPWPPSAATSLPSKSSSFVL